MLANVLCIYELMNLYDVILGLLKKRKIWNYWCIESDSALVKRVALLFANEFVWRHVSLHVYCFFWFFVRLRFDSGCVGCSYKAKFEILMHWTWSCSSQCVLIYLLMNLYGVTLVCMFIVTFDFMLRLRFDSGCVGCSYKATWP